MINIKQGFFIKKIKAVFQPLDPQGCTVSYLKVLNNIRKVAEHLLKSIAALLRYIISVKIAPIYTSAYKVGIFSRKFTLYLTENNLHQSLSILLVESPFVVKLSISPNIDGVFSYIKNFHVNWIIYVTNILNV